MNLTLKNHFPWLDLVRFMAAFMVLIDHVRHSTFVDFGMLPVDQKTMPIATLYALSRLGNEAVIMFFVLSGFLVGGVAVVRIKDRSFKVADYAIDRFVRIMLPLVPALILTAIIGWVMGGEFDVWSFAGNLLSLQGILVPGFGGNAPLWSLPFEVWFYILIGAIGLTVLHKDKVLTGIFWIILFMLVFTKLSVVYWFCWVIGVIAFIYRPSRFSIYLLTISMLLMSSSIVLIEFGQQSYSFDIESVRGLIPPVEILRLLLSIGMALLLQQVSLLYPKSRTMGQIDSMGTSLAAFAYTLYLTHYPLLQLGGYWGVKPAESVSADAVGFLLFEMLVCMVVAWGIYTMFEKHTVKVRRWMKAKFLPVNNSMRTT